MIQRRMEKRERKIGWILGDCLFGWGWKLDKILVDFRFSLSRPTKIIYPIWRENEDRWEMTHLHPSFIVCMCFYIIINVGL